MRGYFRTVLLSFLLLFGYPLFASPEADAALIVQRIFDARAQDEFRQIVRRSFVESYFRPIENAGLRIEIADEDLFMTLIPEADVAPFKERYPSEMAEHFIGHVPQEYLAAVAAIFRADEHATLEDIKFEDIRPDHFHDEYSAMLGQVRRDAPQFTSDIAVVKLLEEVLNLLSAYTLMMENHSEEFAHSFGFNFYFVFSPLRYEREIMQTDREIDNPVTIAAIRTPGVLRFANFTQRQSLLRQLLPEEETRGIRFVQPPRVNSAGN